MDHLVYLDRTAKELALLLDGKKTMLLRGAMGKKDPHHNVEVGDGLFFVLNKGNALVRAKAIVSKVLFYDNLKWEESFNLVDSHQPKLRLTTGLKKKYAGKRNLSFIEIKDVSELQPHLSLKSDLSLNGDWEVVEFIDQLIQKETVN